MPPVLDLLYTLDRFGVDAVMGRPLYAGEIYQMRAVENIVRWYRERQASNNFAAWAMENRDKADILGRAEKEWQLIDGRE